MNNINFQNTGGFPLETETLDEMQKSYSIFNALGEIVGEKAIIKGCKTVGVNVTDGVIYWNGEVLEFRGEIAQTKIIIVDEPTSVEFEDGNVKEVYHERYATFGTGIDAVDWSDFVRAYPLTSALYLDKVDMFAGDLANIPAGWFLCDGQNGTADLRKRFVVGYDATDVDYDAVGKTGGLKEVTLTEAQMPTHKHTGTTNSAGNHRHRLKDGSGGEKTNSITSGGGNLSGQDNAASWVDDSSIIEDNGAHTHTMNLNNSGNSEAHENRPPFYTLAFIQFKGI